jgi:hypothetical protein
MINFIRIFILLFLELFVNNFFIFWVKVIMEEWMYIQGNFILTVFVELLSRGFDLFLRCDIF